MKTLYQNPGIDKPWYQEGTEVPEPAPWNRRNRGFSTRTGTELKNQHRPNTTLLKRNVKQYDVQLKSSV